MIAFMMIRAGLPVVPGVVAMVTLAFLGGLFLTDFTEVVISIINSGIYYVKYAIEMPFYWFGGEDVMIDKIVVRDNDYNVVTTVTSWSDLPADVTGYTLHESSIQQTINGIFNALTIPRGQTSAVVTFMVLYMMTEFFIFFKVLKRIATRGEKMPDIKQRFEVKE